ncbi:MAG: hypothetical protein NVSMB53_17110 [Gemmatimonadaceae bacterium]
MWLTTTRLLESAAALVRERLRHRPPTETSEVGKESGAALRNGSRADLLEEFALIIGVEASCLRLDDRLQDALRVERHELPADHQRLMSKLGLRDVIQPFAIDLLDFVEQRIGNDHARLARFQPWPKNEDEWIDRILGMTIADLIDALA